MLTKLSHPFTRTCRNPLLDRRATRTSTLSALAVSLCHARTKRSAFRRGQSSTLRPLGTDPASRAIARASSSLARAPRVVSARISAFAARQRCKEVYGKGEHRESTTCGAESEAQRLTEKYYVDDICIAHGSLCGAEKIPKSFGLFAGSSRV